MKSSFLSKALFVCAALLLSGCATNPVSLAPSNVPITANDSVTEIGPAEGSAWSGWFLFFPIGGWGHQLQPALDRALKSSGGDALIDVKVESKSYFLLLGTVHRTDIYGTAIKLKKGGAIR